METTSWCLQMGASHLGFDLEMYFFVMYRSCLYIYIYILTKTISHDALRMRLRRLCEKKAKSKRCHVDDETHAQYNRGGSDREWLEMALLETLQKVGKDRRMKGQHKQVVVPCSFLVFLFSVYI